MPRLGLGLGIDKQRAMKSLTQELIDAGCVLYLDASKATGTSVGINSPLTNPWVDLSKNSNSATLVNVAGTSADGYTTQDIGGGVMKPFFKADGVDTYGALANNPSVDITGLTEFGIGLILKTGATLPTGQWVFGKNLSASNDHQYGFLFNDLGQVRFSINGVLANVATGILANTLYSLLVYRKDGNLKCRLTKVETYNVANSVSILTKPNFRLFARSSAVDGTTQTGYSNIWLAVMTLFNGSVKPFTEAQLIKAFDRVAKEYNL